MTPSSADLGAASRLAALRRLYGEEHYQATEPVWGFDDGDAVGVQIDPTGWVVDVRLARLDETMREVDVLRRLLRQAYAHAELVRLASSGERRGPINEVDAQRGLDLLRGRRRIAVRRPERPPHLARQDFVSTPPQRSLETVDRFRVHRGVSREGEITVGVRLTNGLAEIEIDAAWLRVTSVENLRYALKEAFAAAYQQGDV
ncbi:hypothetical protein [Nocardioides sp.]|jgi:hypothetical protein|uniref:hypothetical protein n=1 Tax=Nocardioides sp. TaxID=35761 RepID=UPI0031FE72D1|nr:hypothetical protein [Nocardioides sp.]